MKKQFAYSISACLLALVSSWSQQARAQQALVTENPWGSSWTQVAMDRVYGAGNYTLITDYSSANAGSLFSTANRLVYLEGGDSSNDSLQSFITANQPSILNWVASGKRLLIESAGNLDSSITIGNATLVLNKGTGENYPSASASGSLTPLGVKKFVYFPAASAATGNWLAHTYATLSSGTLNTYAIGQTYGAGGDQPIIAGFKYGKGYIMLSGLTATDFQSPADNNWLENMIAYLNSLTIGPDALNTLSAVQQNSAALSGVYNVQAAALQAGLTYDCNTFDQYGLCASVGGRATYGLTAPSGNQQAGLVVVSHRPDAHFRYGGFADQSVATASPNGIKYNNSGPMFGFFGYWNNQKDQMGLGASVTTAFSNSNLTVTRNASLANTEAGSGNTEMQGQAVQAQATYAIQATTKIKAQPYLGLRYYRVATGGYSEGSNANVTSPLTYNAMAQEVFAAVGGVGTSVFLAEKLTGNASVGIQQNLNYKMGNYQGTSSISGLESFSVNMPSNINSMATATAGLTYAVKKNEKLGVNVLWQQQAFAATNTITALATYSIGF